MMRDTVFQAGPQSEAKRQSSAGWYGFIRAAIVAGFEAYGSAQFGVPPSSMPKADAGDESNERSVPITASNGIGIRSVAKSQVGSVPNVRICVRPDAVNVAWEHA